jgi:hypothetical protein
MSAIVLYCYNDNTTLQFCVISECFSIIEKSDRLLQLSLVWALNIHFSIYG